jgi:hypothetical protein
MSHTTTDFNKLKIYKEKGKVIISKKSKFLGVVELDENEVEEVAATLYQLIVKKNRKLYGNTKRG